MTRVKARRAGSGRGRRWWRRARILLALAGMVALTTAHVGTLDAFYVGSAGPYRVQVTVRPPGVVPGLAQVIVRVDGGQVDRVTTQAAQWNVGSRGAPAPDDAERSPVDSALWTSELWLMTRGSYAVNVALSGTLGGGAVTVPFSSIATARLGMPAGLGWLLGGLGLVLVAGLLSIVAAAARESVLPPGYLPGAPGRRHARIASVVGAGVLALMLTGGRNWWRSVDSAYGARLFVPLASTGTVSPGSSGRGITIAILDTGYASGRVTPIIPDHGKPMHLFLIREAGAGAMAHLHPAWVDSTTFRGGLGALPAGPYRYYADVVHESGFAETLTGRVEVPGGGEATTVATDPDDAIFTGSAVGDVARPGGGLVVTFQRPPQVLPRSDVTLSFTVRDSTGAEAVLEPYMGMPAHAVVAHEDGGVFAHLHGNGSISMAAQQALVAIDRGDTIPGTRPNAPRPRLSDATTDLSEHTAHGGQLAFPFAFPRVGAYVVWVQFRHGGAIRTAAFRQAVR